MVSVSVHQDIHMCALRAQPHWHQQQLTSRLPLLQVGEVGETVSTAAILLVQHASLDLLAHGGPP